jgi:hypothetical protein
MHEGDPYSMYRRKMLAILAFNATAWTSLFASAVYFALNPNFTGLAAFLASFLLSTLALYLFANKLVPDWHSR